MNNHNSLTRNREDFSEKNWVAGLTLIIILATLFRIYQLNSQMWLDEFSAVLQAIRRPWFDIVSIWPGAASHVLYEVLANWSSALLGESAFSVRLPAAIFGVAGVAVLGKLGSRIYSNKAGLFLAALMAVSYNHIFFSQNARGYTALIFFFLCFFASLILAVSNGKSELPTAWQRY